MLLNSPKLKNNSRTICITLRQWAILFSILIFICTAFITTGMVLVTLHNQEVEELLENDIRENWKRKNFQFSDLNKNSSHTKTFTKNDENEAKLEFSLEFVVSIYKFFTIWMWLGWLNLISSAFLIYGVATKISKYMLPWILLSGATYVLGLVAIIILNCRSSSSEFHVNFDYKILSIFSASSVIFLIMWYTVVIYYIQIMNASRDLKIFQTHGGYTHKIQP